MEPGYLDKVLKSMGVMEVEARAALLIFGVVLATALAAFITSRVVFFLEKRAASSKNLWDDALLHALRKPVVLAIWLIGLYGAAEVAYRFSNAEIFKANDTVFRVGIIWLVCWAIVRFVREAEKIVVSPKKVKRPMDATTVSALGKLTRAAVIITAVLVIMQSLGYSISGVLAFGGVGGIAIGFAAKDLLANFFGGLMVYMDRPFKVGEWIRSPDKDIEGTVEHIGWRLTRIRTFDQRPLFVPNSTFTSIAVENPSRMTNRRIYETIGLRYDDVHVMGSVVSDVKSMLEEHPEIDTTQTLMVNFTTFNHSSVDFFIYAFTKTTNWARFHEIKQDVLLKVVDIIANYGAQIAFPTRTLHLMESTTNGQDSSAQNERQPQNAGEGTVRRQRDREDQL